jgi:hypothetical protein
VFGLAAAALRNIGQVVIAFRDLQEGGTGLVLRRLYSLGARFLCLGPPNGGSLLAWWHEPLHRRRLMARTQMLKRQWRSVAANPGHSPPLIGEANGSLVLETLADARAAAPSDDKPIITGMVVLVNLILKSAPA